MTLTRRLDKIDDYDDDDDYNDDDSIIAIK